jgi:hypothetical protein
MQCLLVVAEVMSAAVQRFLCPVLAIIEQIQSILNNTEIYICATNLCHSVPVRGRPARGGTSYEVLFSGREPLFLGKLLDSCELS